MDTRRRYVVGGVLLYSAAFLVIFAGLVLVASSAISSVIRENAAFEDPMFIGGVIIALAGAFLLRLGLRHDRPATERV
jgi:cytochrome c biogenesis factor